METAYEIITITDTISIHFVYVPEGHKLKKVTLEDHKIHKLSRLNSLNRVKKLNNLKHENGCLVKLFRDALTKKGWNFEKFPNPESFIAEFLNPKIKPKK